MENYQDINAKTIERWIENGWKWGIPISHDEYARAQKGDWSVVLTPTKKVPSEWFGNLKGKKLLGLASGGGQQMPIFAAAGAICTVLDYSGKQLESEREVASREGYDIEIIQADMTKRLPFEDETFDLIFHPVSNCYVKDVKPIFKECYRILKKGGVLLAGLGNEINYIVGSDESTIINRMPFDPLVNAEHEKQLKDDDGGMQFSHTLEEQLGGQLKAGFRLLDLYEDTNGEGRLHDLNIKTFIATKAIKE
jgi:SAM-dependent methyltransferase